MSDDKATPEEGGGERIAKRIARAGLASRRDAERMIAAGRVAVDGEVLKSPAVTVTETSVVTVDGVKLPAAERVRLFRYHKPRGLIVSHRDPEGRPTVFANLPQGLPRLIAVGRLDYNSEGLLLLTNDGALARWLELPATGLDRRYRVRVHGEVEDAALARLAQGVTVDGVRYGPIKAQYERRQRTNAWLSVTLQEGKNREIRHVMEHLGLPVSRLIRIGYGPFSLGDIEPNDVVEVPGKALLSVMGGAEALGKHAPGKGWAKAKHKPLPPHKKPGAKRRAGGHDDGPAKKPTRFHAHHRR
jgi:23S rRNA pseudouridine2605 synthase